MAIEDAYELAYREAVRAPEHQRAEAIVWPHTDRDFTVGAGVVAAPQARLSGRLPSSSAWRASTSIRSRPTRSRSTGC